jgi:hypothetical protein
MSWQEFQPPAVQSPTDETGFDYAPNRLCACLNPFQYRNASNARST